MSKDEKETKIATPWRAVHGAVWLVGLAVLAWQDWWWPGILVLVAISMVVEAFLKQYAPQAPEKAQEPETPSTAAPPPAPPAHPPAAPQHPVELLPAVCPKCGGPIRGQEVIWTGDRSADCPYCGANLPLEKSENP